MRGPASAKTTIAAAVFSALALGAAILGAAARGSPAPDDPDGRAMLIAARRIIAAFHEGPPRSTSVLRVVYFHPNDREPLSGYTERLERVLTDISDFYRDGLRRFGIEGEGLPFERRDGRVVLHVVRGKHPARGYRHDSGADTAAEIQTALRDKFDVSREHVLVLYGLCRRERDGRYVFDAPYYGGGSSRAGLAHAADCELLDPLLLTETGKRIIYSEHYYERVEQTHAKFNSWYIGGIAHELGHGLGLPHDCGTRAEAAFGTSLMGAGNHTYRQEVWRGGPPTYLSRGAALQLISHPLFSGSNHARWTEVADAFAALQFAARGNGLRMEGVVTGQVPAYGVVAYVWPAADRTDHGARSFPVIVANGAFTLDITGLKPDAYRLQIASLHVNGAITTRDFRLTFDDAKKPNAAALNAAWIVGRAENAIMKRQPNARSLVTDDAIARAPTPESQRQLRILRAVLEPRAPLDLATTKSDAVYLSDVAWTDAKVGWGKVARNHYWFDQQIADGVFLMLRGKVFAKGLYAHSASRYVYALDGRWKILTAVIGLRDGARSQGSAVFTVRGDGRELYRSPILRPDSGEHIRVDVSGVKRLELLTDGGEGHVHHSWAIWADPRVER